MRDIRHSFQMQFRCPYGTSVQETRTAPKICNPRANNGFIHGFLSPPSPPVTFFTNEEQNLGIRETLNENQTLTIGVVAAIVVLILVFTFWPSGGVAGPGGGGTKNFYSIDDGKSWFADDTKNIPPYD